MHLRQLHLKPITRLREEILWQDSLINFKKREGVYLPLALIISICVHLNIYHKLPFTYEKVKSEKSLVMIQVRHVLKKTDLPAKKTVAKDLSIKESKKRIIKNGVNPKISKVIRNKKEITKKKIKTKKDEEQTEKKVEKSFSQNNVQIKKESVVNKEKSKPVKQSQANTIKAEAVPVFNRDAYIKSIRDIITSNKIYPPLAKRRRISGRVVVRFIILKDGTIKETGVINSSGFTVLDEAALKMVKISSPFPPPPKEIYLTLPVMFELG